MRLPKTILLDRKSLNAILDQYQNIKRYYICTFKKGNVRYNVLQNSSIKIIISKPKEVSRKVCSTKERRKARNLSSFFRLSEEWWRLQAVWPDWANYCTLGNVLKPFATINLPKSPTFLADFCKGVKNLSFSSEIIFGQLL